MQKLRSLPKENQTSQSNDEYKTQDVNGLPFEVLIVP